MSIHTLQKRLAGGGIILMDGAMGTEILRRGFKTTLPLWSAEVLLKKPAIVRQIHEDHIKAGAEIIITNTFATTRRVFAKKGLGERAHDATVLACRLAREARQNTNTEGNVLIAGSVAPLEDCYSPELTPPQAELNAEHRELAQDLAKGGVDFILIETMITLRETEAALRAAAAVGLPVAVSFCVNDKLQLLGGEPLQKVITVVETYNPLFVGVNCVSPAIATKTVKRLRTITQLPISAYAQGDGEPDDDQGWKFNHQDRHKAYLAAAKQWLASGAQLIGGCCGTTPQDITAIAAMLPPVAK